MRKLCSVIVKIFLAVFLTLTIAGCSKKARQASLQSRADGYFKAGEYDKAKIEYMNLLRTDPQNATTFQQIGIIWFEQGAPVPAIKLLLKARELAPANLVVRAKLAQAFMSVGQLAEARKEALAILEQAPGHDEAIVLLAETALTKQEQENTGLHLEKHKAPDRAAVHYASARLLGKKGDIEGAEREIRNALALDPKSVNAHLAMADLFLAKKDSKSAGESFKTAADLAPPRSHARLRHAEFKANSGAMDDAKALLTEMTRKTPDYFPAWRRLAQFAFAEKKYDEALVFLENIFVRERVSIEARLLQSEVWMAKGEIKKAVEGLEHLRKAYPTVPAILYRLAQAYLKVGKPRDAAPVLNELVAANPENLEAVLLLGQVNLLTGEPKAVVESMIGVLKNRPTLLQAQLLLSDAYRALGRFDDAAAIFREQIKASPKNGASHFSLGVVLRQKGSLADARAAFEKAQELSPGNLQAAYQLVELDILAKDFTAAQQRVQSQIQRKPDSARAYFLSGRIYAAQRDWDRAEAALQKTIELDPNATLAYELLTATYIGAGKLTEAIARIEALLARNPDNKSALLTSALLYSKTNAYPKARDAYEKLLARTPDFAPALNNLAVLYSERFAELDKAHELAGRARTLLPDDPSVADSLGWILYKRADYKQALALLTESAGKSPENPEIQFHLGMASYMMGQNDAARTALQLAVKAPADFRGKDEARKRLALLGDGTGGPAGFSSADLEALLKERPGDILVRVRLGEAYEKEGAYPKAAAAFEEALKLNPKMLPALLKLAQLNVGPLKNGAKAVELAKKAGALAPNDPKAAEILGRASYQTGNFPLAYSLLQESTRQPGADAGTLHDFAWAAYSMGKVTLARDAMQRLLTDAPDSPHSEDARSFLAMTALEEGGKDLAAAEPEILKILSANPGHAPALMARAALQLQRGDSKAAEGAYTEILGRLPDFAPAQKGLASLYLADPAKREKAYGIAVKARTTLPDDPELARTLAELSFHRKDFANAIQLFQESGKKRPLDAKALYYLGMSHAQAKDKPQALDALRRAVTAGLPDPLAADAKRALAELEKD